MSESTQMLYAGSPQRYDELLGPDGSIRAPLAAADRAPGRAAAPEAARRSVEMTRRLIVENGVTYNVYADPQGRDRPWQLDPLPLLIAADEWRGIEAGVQQRAQLLNALLADLYGPQQLIAEGMVPAELAFGHPNFLWAAHHTRPRPATPGCISTPPILRARPTDAGGCSAIARRRLRDRATRWKIAPSSAACCRAWSTS